ncbi:MAG: efflux RND transporter permease subunit [Chthonomonadales bacterium]|nr:efflux RND transporter permease subunit [Chthonomonadales bacterium]
MTLTSLAIRRPVFILMMVAALLVLGLNSASKMRLELNPKVDFPFIAVMTVYPGAGPEEIETQVTKKVEDAVASVNGVKEITSSSQEGQSSVTIQFNLGIPSDVAASDVREKVGAIRAALPDDAEEPVVLKFDVGSEPILYYGVTGDRPIRDIRDITDNVIKPRLSQVPGVAAVTVTGGDVREISIGVRKDRLDAYGISITQLVSLLQANNLNFPVGHIVEGNREYSIRVVGEYPNVASIGETRLHMPNGQTVQLSDIADVRDTVEERRDLSRINRKDSVAIVIQKTSEGNTVDVAKGVRAEVAALEKALPEGIKFTVNQDTSVHVEESVADVKASIFLGAFLAVLVVFLFLHNIRGTLIVAIAIPTSIMATFLPMYAFGFTLNTMTMLALSLSVGILVDDSIVVLENIYRHLSRGEPPMEAALNGRGEIGLAAVTITLVDVVVFVPIAFMGGITGQFFRSFGITIACATLFSLLMSFTLTPMLASRWYRAGEAVEAEHGVFGAVNHFYHWLDRIYRHALHWALRFRGIVVYVGSGLLILVFVVIAASLAGKAAAAMLVPLAVAFAIGGALLLWPYRILGLIVTGAGVAAVFLAFGSGMAAGRPLLLFRFAPDQDQGQISVIGELPAGTSLTRTQDVAEHVEDVAASIKDVQNIFTSVGATASGSRGMASVGPQYFTLSMKLRDKESLWDSINPLARTANLRKRSDTEVAQELRKRIGQIAGATIKVAAVTGFQGGGAPLQIDILGDNIGELTRLGQQVLKVFREEPGVLNADVSTRIGKPEQRIDVDRDKAASYGLSVAAIANALRVSIEGDNSSIYREGGNEYRIRVHFRGLDRRNTNEIKSIVVGNVAGPNGQTQPVRLGDVARVYLSTGPTKIDRMNRQKLVSVTANIAPGYAPGNMQGSIERRMEADHINFGPNHYQWGGENKIQNDEQGYMGGALGLSIILVYMLMAALFDNLLYPLVIMVSLPQAMIGALLGLMIAGHALTIVAMIGIIMLVGLVTKNAILLVDYTNTLRSRGYARNDAILEAGPTRLRPILMTTMAMVFGMLPTALGLGRGAEFRAPLATPVIGGLLLSTVLTLLVIPCVYTYFDDASRFLGRHLTRRRLTSTGAAPSEPARAE